MNCNGGLVAQIEIWSEVNQVKKTKQFGTNKSIQNIIQKMKVILKIKIN